MLSTKDTTMDIPLKRFLAQMGKDNPVFMITDSKYVFDTITKSRRLRILLAVKHRGMGSQSCALHEGYGNGYQD